MPLLGPTGVGAEDVLVTESSWRKKYHRQGWSASPDVLLSACGLSVTGGTCNELTFVRRKWAEERGFTPCKSKACFG